MSFKVFSRRMASQRNFTLFIAVAIVLVVGHQWMSIPSSSDGRSSSDPSTHHSWSWSWKDSSLSHLWTVEEEERQRPPTSSDHSLVDDAEDEDPESESDGHRPASGRPSSHSTSPSPLSYGPEPFSYLPPTNLLPLTNLVEHAPGWTSYENIYLSNGTLYIVTTDPSTWPQLRMMISTSMEAVNTAENIRAREPTPYVMSFVSPAEADRMWGDRIWEVKDWTVRGVVCLLERP